MDRPGNGRFTQVYLKSQFPRENEFTTQVLNEALNLYKEMEKDRYGNFRINEIDDAIRRNNYSLKISTLHDLMDRHENNPDTPDITPFDAVYHFKLTLDNLNEERREQQRQERITRNLERYQFPQPIAERRTYEDVYDRRDLPPKPTENKQPDMDWFNMKREEARERRNEVNNMERMERRQRNLERFENMNIEKPEENQNFTKKVFDRYDRKESTDKFKQELITIQQKDKIIKILEQYMANQLQEEEQKLEAANPGADHSIALELRRKKLEEFTAKQVEKFIKKSEKPFNLEEFNLILEFDRMTNINSNIIGERNILESYIKINEPTDEQKFLATLRQAKIFHRGEQAGTIRQDTFIENDLESAVFDHRIYRSYWLNNVSSYDDVMRGIDWIWEHERERNIVKMTFAFGIITENITAAKPESTNNNGIETEVVANYEIHYPTERESIYNPPVFVNEELVPTLKYKVLKGMDNAKVEESTSNTKRIAIFNVNINVYNLFRTGATDPIIHHLINNGYVFSYEGEFNICWFAIGVFEEHFSKNDKAGRLPKNTLESKTKSEWYNFLQLDEDFTKEYEPDLSPKTTKYKKLLEEYGGFQFHEIEKYMKWKNYNIKVYMCDIVTNTYKLSTEYNNPDANENTKLVNIALVFLPDGSETDGKAGRIHTLYIKDVEKVTGLALCPKCKYRVFDISNHNTKHQGTNSAYSNHVKNCDGKIHREQKLVIRANDLPYAPHILQNKTYKYLLANERLNEFKPRQYYITFDFETMEETTEIKVGSSSKILAKLKPLSVAATIKTKNNIETVYKDIRDGAVGDSSGAGGDDFVKQWLEIVIEKAKQVKIDNSYDDKDIPYENYVPVLGFNSSRFDLNFLLQYLSDPSKWDIKKCMGLTNFKMISVVTNNKDEAEAVELKFLDLMNFVSAPATLDKTVKDFCDGKAGGAEDLKKNELKGCFAYEAAKADCIYDVLDLTYAFSREEFYSYLKKKEMTLKEYVNYLIDWFNLKNAGVIKNRWDYLKYYNIQDTMIMLKPIDYLIKENFKDKVDMLQYLTLASDSSVLKYSYAYKDFDVKMNFKRPNTNFKVPKEWLNDKCRSYNEQDKKAKRQSSNNVSVRDLENINKMLKNQDYCCSICGSVMSIDSLSFDRIDCSKSHTIDNITLACQSCNIARSNRDFNIVRLESKLKNFADEKGLPYVPDDERVINLLQDGITGGLSNVHHRKNIAGETKINRLSYDIVNKKVISKDLPHVMTHVCSFDFNSLYPSDYSSIYNEEFPYTDHRMYMPGKIIKYYGSEEKDKMMEFINCRDTLFIAKVKAHIPEERYNDFITFPPIIRNIEIEVNNNYKNLNKNKEQKTERKLTQLLSTMGGYMCFNNYYLWTLIDYFGLIIDDVKELATFTKHNGFEKFVCHFMDERIEAIKKGNNGKNKYAKMILNAAFGKDGLNTKNYNKTEILTLNEALFKQSDVRFLSSRQISDNLFAVSMSPSNYTVSTPLQCAVWTLDNAKVWYLMFLYKFMYRAFDMDKFHYIEGDTDSMYFAIAGDPMGGYKQGFEHIIKDRKFYDENVYKWLPNPNKGEEDKKKLLGVCIEREGSSMIAVAPKCYYITTYKEPKKTEAYIPKENTVMKIKGVSLTRNKIKSSDYDTVVNESKIIKGQNCGFHMKMIDGEYRMVKLETEKNAITPVHNKMICLPNYSCAPIIEGLKREDYLCE